MAVHCVGTCIDTRLGTAPLPNACTRISSVRQLCGENEIPLCIIYLYHPPFGQIETIAYVSIDKLYPGVVTTLSIDIDSHWSVVMAPLLLIRSASESFTENKRHKRMNWYE